MIERDLALLRLCIRGYPSMAPPNSKLAWMFKRLHAAKYILLSLAPPDDRVTVIMLMRVLTCYQHCRKFILASAERN